MPKLNAIDAISPAFQLAKLNLFKPFRWSFWWRVALLGLLTGELSSGGGGANFNFPANWPPPQHRGGDQLSLLARPFPNFDPHLLWVLIPALIVGFVIFILVMMYLGSVCRFILLEAVLNGQVSIRDAWGRWKDQGARFFGFQLALQLIFLAVTAVVIVLFLMVVGVSIFKGGGDPSGAKIGAIFGEIMLLILALALLAIPYFVIFILAKDFAVPVMALEGATFGEAWRKVWNMAKNETGSILGYFGMKIVLTIGAGVIFGIIGMIAMFVILLPVGGVGVLAVLAGKSAGLTWNLYTITLAVSIGLLVLFLLICVFALISVPVAMFFPAYGLYFFAGRYKPLHDRLFPSPPQPPPAPEPPPDISPEPITS